MTVSTAEEVFDLNVRVENMVWIPGIGDVDATADAFSRNFVEWLPESEDAPIYKALPQLLPFASEDGASEAAYVAMAIYHVPGFLVEVARPVMTPLGANMTFSWGHYYTAWLYAKDEASLLPVIREWAAELDAKDRATAPA